MVSADVGRTIKVSVTFTDDAGNEESLSSVATGTVEAIKPGAPEHLKVFPHDAGALDVHWEAPASDGGSAITGYKVQWKAEADSWDTPSDVSEETVTGATHTITGLTDGVEYSVRVRAMNGVGEGSPAAEASGTPLPAAIWSATLTVGTAEKFAGYTIFVASPESNTLGALSSDTITVDDASYTVKALAVLDGKLILSVSPKPPAGFVLVAGTAEFAFGDASTRETDHLLQFYWNDPGLTWSEGEEVAVRLTEGEENTPATGAPTITGTAQAGQTLTADTPAIADADGLAGVSFSYQWTANDGSSDADIEDATDSTYTPSVGDVGETIKVRVSFRDDANNAETLTSAATEAVLATVPTEPQGLSVTQRSQTQGSQTQELDAAWQAPLIQRRFRYHRLQGAVEGGWQKLGHPGRRLRGRDNRDQSHHCRSDRRGGIRRAGDGHQRHGRRPGLRRGRGHSRRRGLQPGGQPGGQPGREQPAGNRAGGKHRARQQRAYRPSHH